MIRTDHCQLHAIYSMIHLFLLNFICQLHCAQRKINIGRSYLLIRFIVLFLLLCSVFVPIDALEKEYEGRSLALMQLNYSQRQTVSILKNDEINVSQQTVSNVKKKDRSPTKFRRESLIHSTTTSIYSINCTKNNRKN